MKTHGRSEAQAPVPALCAAALLVVSDYFPEVLQAKDTVVIKMQEALEIKFLEVLAKE